MIFSLNKKLHSPLTLAAYQINKKDIPTVMKRKVKMLKYLLYKLKTTLWSYGPITEYEMNMKGLEMKYDLSKYQHIPVQQRDIFHQIFGKSESELVHHSVISWLCQNEAETAVIIPEIRRLIERKWERCGLILFLASFIMDFVVMMVITLISIFINTTFTFHPLYFEEWFVNILYAIVVFIFAGTLFFDAIYTFSRHSTDNVVKGVVKFHVWCKLTKIISFAIFLIFQIVSSNQNNYYLHDGSYYVTNNLGIKIPLVISIMASWIHLFYYLMAFEKTGNFMIVIFYNILYCRTFHFNSDKNYFS